MCLCVPKSSGDNEPDLDLLDRAAGLMSAENVPVAKDEPEPQPGSLDWWMRRCGACAMMAFVE